MRTKIYVLIWELYYLIPGYWFIHEWLTRMSWNMAKTMKSYDELLKAQEKAPTK